MVLSIDFPLSHSRFLGVCVGCNLFCGEDGSGGGVRFWWGCLR